VLYILVIKGKMLGSIGRRVRDFEPSQSAATRLFNVLQNLSPSINGEKCADSLTVIFQAKL
jgi:hypothetical protein